MNGVELRQATLKDLDAMLEVWRVSDEDASDTRRREVAKALELLPDLVVVAETEGQIVGVILGTTDGLFGYPKRLIVRPTHRRQGVGRALISELERRFVARGIHRLNALIRRGNVASMALSSSRGYEHEETVTVWVKTLSQRHRDALASDWWLLLDFDAFFLEHRRCGDLDSGASEERAWLARVACGALIGRRVEDAADTE